MDQISKDIEEYQEECKKKNKRKKMAAEMLKKKVQEAKHRQQDLIEQRSNLRQQLGYPNKKFIPQTSEKEEPTYEYEEEDQCDSEPEEQDEEEDKNSFDDGSPRFGGEDMENLRESEAMVDGEDFMHEQQQYEVPETGDSEARPVDYDEFVLQFPA